LVGTVNALGLKGVSLAILIAMCAPGASAAAIETRAQQALLIDMTTGAELLSKNADSAMAPASMTKIMTADLVFERLRDGRLSLDDTLPVSETAWRKGGSKMFVEVGAQVSVEDLLRGIIVQSGNDASIVVAEALAGSEEAFGEMMTKKAREIGMRSTTFRNATGWPEPDHLTTARDMATLAMHTIREYPEYYHFYSETSFTFNKIKQGNRNPLLYKDFGADGLKTGHTEVSGYGLTASAKRGDRRLILVVNGLPDVQARSDESQRLLEWGFREFDNYSIFNAGDVIERAKVWLGAAEDVPLVLGEDLVATLPRNKVADAKIKAVVPEPVPAPIKAGDPIGKLVIDIPDHEPIEAALYAGADVGELDFVGRVLASIKHMIFGAAGSLAESAN